MSILVEHTSTYDATAISALEGFSSELNRMPLAASKANPMTDREMARHAKITGYTDLMVDGAPSPHQSDTTLRWLIDRLRS
ncbi:hypothetical protein OF001_U470001 [Pseudomonas sp. OF001]|uniref:hypothetical protein n=1 Tax=Pseudomonas sp. OF001 TaxID=2772300 RepID=UPI001919C821|nr:hypothetical protein OF001_U470001 [Pseudomonas sp. OF001]